MGETTNITWADSTLNIWMGCTKVSTGPKGACEHCYAEVQTPVRALGVKWGNDAERRETKSWSAQLRKISRRALAEGRPWFVFVNSLSDFWDNKASASLRAEALEEFRKHPHLTFLLLTKRPQNILKMARAMAEDAIGSYVDTETGLASWWPRNCALMCTVVTQPEADRDLPWLLKAQAALRPAFAGVSMEPLMEHVDIAWALSHRLDVAAGLLRRGHFDPGLEKPMRVGWVITGGETDQGKNKARPSHPGWFRDLRDQCAAAGVPFHFKQWGEWAPGENAGGPQVRTGEGAVLANDGEWWTHRYTPAEGRELTVDDGPDVWRVGKKAAGRLLDGVLHDGRPETP